MVERAIGEMVGSDRVPPDRLHASLRHRWWVLQPKRYRSNSSEFVPPYARKTPWHRRHC